MGFDGCISIFRLSLENFFWLCRIFLLNLRQNIDEMSEYNIEQKVISCIKKCGRGSFFFSADFVRFGELKSINKALERLCNDGIIIRVGRGIYYYPKIDRALNLGVLYPSLEQIANAVAKRDNARIVPTGIYALNRLGFSTQVPTNVVYLTDGSPRKITLSTGGTIQFKRTAPKNLAFNSDLAMLLTFAFKSIGKENVTEEMMNHARFLLHKDASQTVKSDYKRMPAWVSSIIKSLYEE